ASTVHRSKIFQDSQRLDQRLDRVFIVGIHHVCPPVLRFQTPSSRNFAVPKHCKRHMTTPAAAPLILFVVAMYRNSVYPLPGIAVSNSVTHPTEPLVHSRYGAP